MKCLYCGRELGADATKSELNDEWHKHCVREFFGTEELPELSLSEDELERLAQASVDDGMTVPGVQKKMSLHLESGSGKARLTLIDYPAGYILKPQTKEYQNLPEYEDAAMRLARVAGVKTVPFALFRVGKRLAYITKRVDRGEIDGKSVRYAMEDFCQLTERLAEDKYKGSYEGCARVIKKFSRQPRLDLAEMFLRVVTSFVIGNSDMHLKNFSLIEMVPGVREFRLSLAYDILPVNVVEPRDLDEMALSLNGKKRGIELEDLMALAEYCEISGEAAQKMITGTCAKMDKYVAVCDDAHLNAAQKMAMVGLISERCRRIEE